MLRVGLTGGLGSGKTTAARRFAELGAHVLSADEVGRAMMQPGERVYAEIVAKFGPEILKPDGSLDRAALAKIAFGEGSGGSKIAELNGIVHPATIARQEELVQEIAAREPDAVIVIESALIFETKFGGEEGWRRRFDKIVLVRASEQERIARFVARIGGPSPTEKQRRELEGEARRRMAQQIPDDWKAAHSNYVLINESSVADLLAQVDAVWPRLKDAARSA